MGGSRREAAKAVALGRKLERRRSLRWWEPARQTRRRWRRGEEFELGCGREENGEKRERVVVGSFSSASVAQGNEGKKEGPLRARSCSRGRRRRGGPGHGGRQRGAANNGPRPSGTSGGAVVQRGRVKGRGPCGAGTADRWGRDELWAQCQQRVVGGRGVSEAA
jgi:hypothetical protein